MLNVCNLLHLSQFFGGSTFSKCSLHVLSNYLSNFKNSSEYCGYFSCMVITSGTSSFVSLCAGAEDRWSIMIIYMPLTGYGSSSNGFCLWTRYTRNIVIEPFQEPTCGRFLRFSSFISAKNDKQAGGQTVNKSTGMQAPFNVDCSR